MGSFAHYLSLLLGLRTASRRALFMNVALLVVFGVLVPRFRGYDFFDPVMICAYASLSILLAGPAAAQIFSDRPHDLAGVFRRIAAAVAYGEIMSVGALIAGIVTVNQSHWHGSIVFPDSEVLFSGLALGVSGSLAIAAAAGWITLRFSVGFAHGAMRIVFLVLLGLFFFWSRWLPDVAAWGAVVCLAAALALIAGLRRAVKNPGPAV